MRGRWLTWFVGVTLATVLGGCTSPASDDDDASPPRVEAPRMALELADCREQIGIYPITQQAAAPYLPEGFAPMPALPPEFYPDADPTGTTATLLVLGFSCSQPAASLFFAYLPAVPPEDARLEDAYYHAVAVPCMADNASAITLAQWSVPCNVGAVSITETMEAPAGAVWRLEVHSDGTEVALDGGAPASMTPAGPELIRVFHVQEREVCAVVDLRVEAHEHWQFAAATLDVQGPVPFPVPSHPGLSSLGRPGFAMNFTHVPESPALSGGAACP